MFHVLLLGSARQTKRNMRWIGKCDYYGLSGRAIANCLARSRQRGETSIIEHLNQIEKSLSGFLAESGL